MRALVLLLFLPLACLAQQPHEQEIQRALIELDRRTADFSNRTLENPHVGRPLHPDPEIARQLRPYERMTTAEQHSKPLPLPGGPRAGVDSVTLPGLPD